MCIARRLLPLLALAALMFPPAPAHAQGMGIAEVLEAIRLGGGWVRIPIEGGRGGLRTLALPSAGRVITGCMEIWEGHSGRWSLDVEDTFGNGRLEAEAAPADDIPFEYATGPMAQLEVGVEWSEPRDTTLMVWIGLDRPGRERDACQPLYPDADGAGRRP